MNFERWQIGEVITARHLNQVGDALTAARLEGITLGGNGGVPNSVPIACTVVSVHADHLICRPLGLDTNVVDFAVAKPWELCKTPFHAKILPNKDGTLLSYAYSITDLQKRTVTDTADSSTEDQVIVPAYVAAQTIADNDYTGTQITVQRVANGTGVSYRSSPENYLVQVEFEDMNRAGRAWAEVVE